jgi:tRNA threonylcarbamoyladenosine biosynthesis protein TsaE
VTERRTTHGPRDTEALGAELARELRAGDVVLLEGEMGTGKTTLVRGACRALGVTGPVTSPTFTLGRRYEGRLAVSHLDLHRLGSLADEDPGLLADYVGPDRLAFVEWPEAGAAELAADVPRLVRVRLAHAGGDRRTVEIDRPALAPQPSGAGAP